MKLHYIMGQNYNCPRCLHHYLRIFSAVITSFYGTFKSESLLKCYFVSYSLIENDDVIGMAAEVDFYVLKLLFLVSYR